MRTVRQSGSATGFLTKEVAYDSCFFDGPQKKAKNAKHTFVIDDGKTKSFIENFACFATGFTCIVH